MASDVQSQLEQARTSFSSYLRIRSLASAASPELASAKSELTALLSELTTDLTDLSEAVRAVEADPYKFGLDVSDVAGRRRFVDEVAGEVEDMNEEISREASRTAALVIEEERADPVQEYERQQQQMLMREQDAQLEGVARTVGNLREQAHVMGQELGEQAELLDAFEGDVERVEGKLKRGGRDLANFIKKNEGECGEIVVPGNVCVRRGIRVLTKGCGRYGE